VTAPTIGLPPLATQVDELWHVLLDLGDQLTVGWTLVGGQMVLLHALEHGRVPGQISQDVDVVADVRTRPSAVPGVVAALEAAGFEPSIPSADWRIAIGRLATDPDTRAYLARRTGEGKTKTEVIRCIKRYIAREVFAALPQTAAG
jgi:hypothetical protein